MRVTKDEAEREGEGQNGKERGCRGMGLGGRRRASQSWTTTRTTSTTAGASYSKFAVMYRSNSALLAAYILSAPSMLELFYVVQ